MTMIYAGIGSRETPAEILSEMQDIGQALETRKWMLRSGGAKGADTAFLSRAATYENHLPWSGYNGHSLTDKRNIVPELTQEIIDIAARFHPAWERLSRPVKILMCRNVTIVLGQKLDQHAKMVVCWTPNGRLIGGTSHGMKIAMAYDIPVFNLANFSDGKKLVDFVRNQ